MPSKDREKKVLYINHVGEFLIWLIVILTFILFSSLGMIFKEKNRENDYRVFLPDVDGLIVGSPVRMMGIDVGHVIKIKPVKDEVYVKFLITNPDVYIPHGTLVTVEFSGMAGSRSLELYPPDKNSYIDKDTPVMRVEPPKRLHDALFLLDDMYKKIGSIIYSSSAFGKKLNDAHIKLDMSMGEKAEIGNFLEYSDNFLDNSKQKADDVRQNIEERLLKNAK